MYHLCSINVKSAGGRLGTAGRVEWRSTVSAGHVGDRSDTQVRIRRAPVGCLGPPGLWRDDPCKCGAHGRVTRRRRRPDVSVSSSKGQSRRWRRVHAGPEGPRRSNGSGLTHQSPGRRGSSGGSPQAQLAGARREFLQEVASEPVGFIVRQHGREGVEESAWLAAGPCTELLEGTAGERTSAMWGRGEDDPAQCRHGLVAERLPQ